MKLHLNLLLSSFLIVSSIVAQETGSVSNDSLMKNYLSLKKEVDIMKRIKINGWIQAQYQLADTAGAANYDGGDLPANVDSRFMIRRGRIKFTYENDLVQYVFQLNATERFVNIADIYGKITDPWTKWFSFQMGVMNRPFGYDIQLSSQYRESPERARYTQILTPNERDMGAEVIVEAPKTSKYKGLILTAGFFNGTGLTIPFVNISDIDSKKDFIGRLAYYTPNYKHKLKYGGGFSHYNGYERMANNVLYNDVKKDTAGNLKFYTADTSNTKYKGDYSKRLYFGLEAMVSAQSLLGTTTLRGEYNFGQQPASASTSKSPQVATSGATYARQFNSAYVYFIHRILKSKHEIVVKYEWYDPNSKVSGNQINPAYGFTVADIKYTAIGLGYNWYFNDNFKIMLYYNMVTNETSNKMPGFSRDLPDNILTARMQVRF